MKNGFHSNIVNDTLQNDNFRKVLYTGAHMQLVVMTLQPGEDIGVEVHPDIDQFFRVEEGIGEVIIDGEAQVVADDDVAIVPAGSEHNVVNTGDKPLKLYTIYTPPEHPAGTVHATKAEADAAEHDHHH